MNNVATVFGKSARKIIPFNKVDWPLPEQLIGVEIELETFPGVVHPTNLVPYWTKVRDGSLRNGMEYILAQPLKGDALSRAIYELFHGAVLTRSTTGSTHVHIDMMEEATTPDTIKVMVMLAFILEPAVFAIADPGREWCGYTNKLSSAPDALIGSVMAADVADGYSSLKLLCTDGYRVGRYYGLNLMALSEHGSIEFRYFPTATSVDDVIEWVSLVQSFKKAALELGTVSQLLETVNSADLYDSFLSNYFGRWKEVFLAKVPNYMAADSVRKAMAVAGSYTHKRTDTHRWDETAITGSKTFSKFIKKGATASEVGTIHITRGGQLIPEGTDIPNGDVLLYRGHIYFRAGHTWRDTFDYYRPDANVYQVELRKAIRTVMAQRNIIADLQQRGGESAAYIASTADRLTVLSSPMTSQDHY